MKKFSYLFFLNGVTIFLCASTIQYLVRGLENFNGPLALIAFFGNPLMIYVLDYIIRPSMLDNWTYILLIIGCNILGFNFHFFYQGVLEISSGQYGLFIIMQLGLAILLRSAKANRAISIPLLLLLPAYEPLKFLYFIFAFITGYKP